MLKSALMTEHKKFPMRKLPVTVYRDDPFVHPMAEWHELWTAQNPTTSEFVLCQHHGWWDEETKQAHFNVPVLSEPFKTEEAADAALDQEISSLAADGWIHQFTTVFDPDIMQGRGIKIMTEPERQNAVFEVIKSQGGLTASEIANRARIMESDAIKVIRILRSIDRVEEYPTGSETYRVPPPAQQGGDKGQRR